MSETQSRKMKSRWVDVPVEVRRKKMRKLAKLKNEKMTPEERKAHASKMVKARWKKYYDIKKRNNRTLDTK